MNSLHIQQAICSFLIPYTNNAFSAWKYPKLVLNDLSGEKLQFSLASLQYTIVVKPDKFLPKGTFSSRVNFYKFHSPSLTYNDHTYVTVKFIYLYSFFFVRMWLVTFSMIQMIENDEHFFSHNNVIWMFSKVKPLSWEKIKLDYIKWIYSVNTSSASTESLLTKTFSLQMFFPLEWNKWNHN